MYQFILEIQKVNESKMDEVTDESNIKRNMDKPTMDESMKDQNEQMDVSKLNESMKSMNDYPDESNSGKIKSNNKTYILLE